MSLFAPPYMTIQDEDGNPVSGGKLFFYATETSTPASVYADGGLTTPLTNPVVADSAGRCAAVYLDPTVIYRCKVTTAAGATIRDVDPIDNPLSALGASDGSSLVTFIQAGAGAVARTVQDKLRETVSVKDFGAIGDWETDDAPAIRACIAANPGKRIFFPKPGVCYRLGSSLGNIPQGTLLEGPGRHIDCLKRDFNGGYMATLLDQASIANMQWDGNGVGGARTGGILNIPVGHGRQNLADFNLLNAHSGACINIECTGATDAEVGGSQMSLRSFTTSRADGASGSGFYHIVHADPGVAAAGHPIAISHWETGSHASLDAGACSDLYISNSTLGDIKTGARSLGGHINNCRIAPIATPQRYTNFSFTNCGFGPAVEFDTGATADNTCYFNNGATDVSPTGGSPVSYWDNAPKDYVPNIRAGSSVVGIGNGSVVAKWRRRGADIEVNVTITVGSTTTNIDAGPITISMPTDQGRVSNQTLFSGRVVSAADVYRKIGAVFAAADRISLDHDAGLVAHLDPVDLVTPGATIAISGIYTR